MENIDPILSDIQAARSEGRSEKALQLVLALFRRTESGELSELFYYHALVLNWRLLADAYPPARSAMSSARDEQQRLLLAGDGDAEWRFRAVVHMNETLAEPLATSSLFVQLDAQRPEFAWRVAHRALSALVEAGEYTLADRYMTDPLGMLDYLNGVARDLPLFPAAGAAPRLAADLMNFTGGIVLRATVLRGLGRASEVDALFGAALAGIEADEVRAYAQRELATPGTIRQELTNPRA